MLPDAFVRTVLDVHEEVGAAWLDGFAARLAHFADVWELDLGAPFALSYNYVAPATQADGTAAVLKLGVPCYELTTEVAALRLYDGRGCARLLAVDEAEGALLLERVQPGAPLSTLADDETATRHAAAVMAALWRPLPAAHPFNTPTPGARGGNTPSAAAPPRSGRPARPAGPGGGSGTTRCSTLFPPRPAGRAGWPGCAMPMAAGRGRCPPLWWTAPKGCFANC